MCSEPIDEITKTLPHHHFDKRVRHEITVAGLDVGTLDICQRMGEVGCWGVRKSIQVRHEFVGLA